MLTARGAARERINHTAPEALLATATVSNGGYCTRTVVQMATPEHRRGRSDPAGRCNWPGLGVNGPRGRPRSLRRRASAGLPGRLETKSRRSTFEYIVKPEVMRTASDQEKIRKDTQRYATLYLCVSLRIFDVSLRKDTQRYGKRYAKIHFFQFFSNLRA